MHRTYELNLLLLIEGMSVPISSAQISFKVNQPAMASFDLVPLKEILDIRPRSFCQFFVKDYMNDSKYKLAFEGEVFACGFSVQAAGARAFQIQAMDITNYWDHTPLRFLNATAENIVSKKYSIGIASKDTPTTITVTKDMTNYLANELTTFLNEAKGDVTIALKNFMAKFAETNSFYRNTYNRYRFLDRIIASSSGKLEEALQYKVTKELLEEITNMQGGEASFRAILDYFLAQSFHQVVTVPFPTYAGGQIKQFVFKPDSLFLAPPKCNLVFPNQYTGMTIMRNFFAEATRVLVKANPMTVQTAPLGEPFDRLFAAPGFYERLLRAEVPYDATFSGGLTDTTTGAGVTGEKFNLKPEKKAESYSKDFTHEFQEYSKEEYMKGIFPAPLMQIPDVANYMISQAKENASTKAVDTMLANMAYYMYYKGRYAQRTSSVTGRLNLSPVPGFPILFIDDQDSAMNVVAQLDTVVHSFSTAMGSTTTYFISHARQTEEKADFAINTFSEPPVPPWFDKSQFGETQAASSVLSSKGPGAEIRKEVGNPQGFVTNFGTRMNTYYQDLIGCNVCTDNNHKSIMEAARYYADGFSSANDKEAYVRDIIKRNFTDIDETMGFLGATGYVTSGTSKATTASYSGGKLTEGPGMYGTILKERRKVIERFRAKIDVNKSFSGS